MAVRSDLKRDAQSPRDVAASFVSYLCKMNDDLQRATAAPDANGSGGISRGGPSSACRLG